MADGQARLPAARQGVPPRLRRRGRRSPLPRNSRGVRPADDGAGPPTGIASRRGPARRAPAEPWRADPARARQARERARTARGGAGAGRGRAPNGPAGWAAARPAARLLRRRHPRRDRHAWVGPSPRSQGDDGLDLVRRGARRQRPDLERGLVVRPVVRRVLDRQPARIRRPAQARPRVPVARPPAIAGRRRRRRGGDQPGGCGDERAADDRLDVPGTRGRGRAPATVGEQPIRQLVVGAHRSPSPGRGPRGRPLTRGPRARVPIR